MRTFVFAAFLFAACADPTVVDEPIGPATAIANVDSKADGTTSSELRARAGEMTVWTRVRATTDHASDYGFRVVVHGRASRDLEPAFAWVPDDAFGEARVVSARRFELVLDEAHEISTVMSGAPIFVTLRAKSGTNRDYYVRLELEPRFAAFKGSKTIFVREDVQPIYVRDGLTNLRFRGLASTTAPADHFAATTDDDSDAEVHALDATTFTLDWSFTNLALAMTPSTNPVRFAATFGTRVESKQAELAPSVIGLAVSTEDPYLSLIHERTCDADVRACIADSGDDLGDCGSYREVQTCLASGPICGADSPDLELFPIDVSGLGVAGLAGFRLPDCLAALPDVAGLAHMLRNMDAYDRDWDGITVTRGDLAVELGARLDLGTLDGWAGSMSAEHWFALSDDLTLVVVYYPSVGRLFALTY